MYRHKPLSLKYKYKSLSADLQRIMALSSEKGTSSWLSALPVDEHGFALHKGTFCDALCLHYGWLPSGLPTQCVCGKGYSLWIML